MIDVTLKGWEQLERRNGYRLTLIVAPSDAAWTERLCQDQPIAWVTLTAADNVPERFLATLVEALGAICPAVRSVVEQDVPLDNGMIDLLNALLTLSHDVVLLLEDYDVIEAPVIHNAVARMLDYLPPHLRLVIVSRQVPPLPNLPRLRARRQLWQVGPTPGKVDGSDM